MKKCTLMKRLFIKKHLLSLAMLVVLPGLLFTGVRSYGHSVYSLLDSSPFGSKSPVIIDIYPHVESLEHGGILPSGWQIRNSGGSFNWQVNAGPTPTANTGPSGDNTSGTGYYTYTHAASGNTGDEAMLVSPQLDLSTLNYPRVNFWFHMFGNHISSLSVDVAVGGVWLNNIDVLTGQSQTSSSDNWQMHSTDLTGYANLDSIRFRVVRGNGAEGDVAIDDIAFGEPLDINLGPDTAICQGTSTTLDAGSFPGSSYKWYTTSSTSLISVSQSIQVDSAATYYVVVKGAGAFSGTDTTTIHVDPLPPVSLSSQNGPSYCLNSPPDTLSGTPSGGIYSGNGVFANTFNPSVAGTGTHTIYYQFTSLSGCKAKDSITVTVHNVPNVNAGPHSHICPGDTATLTATTNAPFLTWSTNQYTNSIQVSPAVSTTYTVTATDNVGCSNTDSVNVIITSPPYIDFGADTINACADGSTALYPGDFLAYNWSTGETTPTIYVDSSGVGLGGYKTVSVTVTDSIGCSNSQQVTLQFVQTTTTTIQGPDTLNYYGHAIYNAGSGFQSYQWSTGDSTQMIILEEHNLQPGENTIYVTVKDHNGCPYTATKVIFADPTSSVEEHSSKPITTLYPNPTRGNFTLDISTLEKQAAIKIFSLNGQAVYERLVYPGKNLSLDFHLPHLASGTYILQLINQEAATSHKLIIH